MSKKSRASCLLLLGLFLLSISVTLLVLSATYETPSAALQIPVAAQPSPPWEILPTRAIAPAETPAPTATPEADPLGVMRLALAHDAFEVAEAAWEEARRVTPEDSLQHGRVMREGARLALLRGDLDAAEARIWGAVRTSAKEAETWALVGVILAQQGNPKIAESALRIAETLDPGLAPDVFADRWRAARQTRDGDVMSALAQTYSSHEPDNPLGFYYRAAAMFASGQAEGAFSHLLIQLRAEPDSAAVLWYALGEAYLMQRAYNEALIVFTVAQNLFNTGDLSLYLASDDPQRDLDMYRGRALLGINDPQHCAQAEPLLRRGGAPADVIARASLCQTPTPTLTPWIPAQIITYPPR